MIGRNYPYMYQRMKIGEMPGAARPVLDRYQAELRATGSFNPKEFLEELCKACRCNNHRATMEMISAVWHATRDPALVYYFEHIDDRQPEYDYYLQCAFGAKRNRVHRPITELKEQYWMAFYAALGEEGILCH